MSSEFHPFGIWPMGSVGDVTTRGFENNTRLLGSLKDSVTSQLREIRSEVGSAYGSSSNELVFVQSAIEDIASSMSHSSAQIVGEIRRLAGFLGCALELTNKKIDSGNAMLSKLVFLSEQILEVLRNPLTNTARQHAEQGLVWFYQNEYQRAEAQFTKALEYDTTFHLAYLHLGHIYFRRGDDYKTFDNFRLAEKTARSPEEAANSNSCMARYYLRKGDFSGARIYVNSAVRNCPNAAVYRFEQIVYGYPESSAYLLERRMKELVELDSSYAALFFKRNFLFPRLSRGDIFVLQDCAARAVRAKVTADQDRAQRKRAEEETKKKDEASQRARTEAARRDPQDYDKFLNSSGGYIRCSYEEWIYRGRPGIDLRKERADFESRKRTSPLYARTLPRDGGSKKQ